MFIHLLTIKTLYLLTLYKETSLKYTKYYDVSYKNLTKTKFCSLYELLLVGIVICVCCIFFVWFLYRSPIIFRSSSVWFSFGSRLVLVRFSIGSRLVLVRFSIGSRLVLVRFSIGSRSVLDWFSIGSRSVLDRFSIVLRSILVHPSFILRSFSVRSPFGNRRTNEDRSKIDRRTNGESSEAKRRCIETLMGNQGKGNPNKKFIFNHLDSNYYGKIFRILNTLPNGVRLAREILILLK